VGCGAQICGQRGLALRVAVSMGLRQKGLGLAGGSSGLRGEKLGLKRTKPEPTERGTLASRERNFNLGEEKFGLPNEMARGRGLLRRSTTARAHKSRTQHRAACSARCCVLGSVEATPHTARSSVLGSVLCARLGGNRAAHSTEPARLGAVFSARWKPSRTQHRACAARCCVLGSVGAEPHSAPSVLGWVLSVCVCVCVCVCLARSCVCSARWKPSRTQHRACSARCCVLGSVETEPHRAPSVLGLVLCARLGGNRAEHSTDRARLGAACSARWKPGRTQHRACSARSCVFSARWKPSRAQHRTQAHTHTQTSTNAQNTHTDTNAHKRTHAHTHTHTQTSTNKQNIHTQTSTNTHRHTQTSKHKRRKHKHKQAQTHTRTHTPTSTRTNAQKRTQAHT
jgi:hypothetical protein